MAAKGKPVTVTQADIDAAAARGLSTPPTPGTWAPIAGRKFRNEETGETTTRRRVDNARMLENFDRKAKRRREAGIAPGPARGRKLKTGIKGVDYVKPKRNVTQQYTYFVQVSRKDGSKVWISVVRSEKQTKAEIRRAARAAFTTHYASKEYAESGFASLEVMDEAWDYGSPPPPPDDDDRW